MVRQKGKHLSTFRISAKSLLLFIVEMKGEAILRDGPQNQKWAPTEQLFERIVVN